MKIIIVLRNATKKNHSVSVNLTDGETVAGLRYFRSYNRAAIYINQLEKQGHTTTDFTCRVASLVFAAAAAERHAKESKIIGE